ncbi:glycosyltransferase family A protein [Mycolicibacterium sp. 050158]|uniref:glycosyltransferase family A protein n=1 Tax=Mycolicibacterium sp. 050158 TaxID=3090602 RepID=UPI00299D24E9|nr:glycosyltransferase family A protein [Mycolicibacterium sp. 050158]MDX1889116.1 glycosyltransferase family A protein [Mycolicibacterium sp. 050158]
MLAFVTTLRHPHNSRDYAHVERLLRESLRSITRQTHDDYVVVIVGNQAPRFALPPRTHFVEVDFDPPSLQRGPHTGATACVWDKGTKTGVALAWLRASPPDYVMLLDADDFIHRDLVAYVHRHPTSPGWVVKRGYAYSRRRNVYAWRRRLDRICGTSFILPFAALGVPPSLRVDATAEAVADAFGDDVLEQVLAGHRYALDWWRRRGRHLQTLPFAGVVYHLDTGENHSGNRLLGPAWPHGRRMHDEFGVPSSKPPLATWWSAFGAPAWRPDLRPRRPFFLKPRASQLPPSR